MKKKFEYKKVGFHEIKERHYDQIDEIKLNLEGQDGWELVTIVSGECIFKREIEND